MADDAGKKALAERDKIKAEQEEHRAKMKGTPTPTQEEADKIKLGLHPELAPDGSTDPHAKKEEKPAASSGGYSTRQAQAKPA